jgi:hypothetical protein
VLCLTTNSLCKLSTVVRSDRIMITCKGFARKLAWLNVRSNPTFPALLFLPGVKWPEREVDDSSTSSAEVKKSGAVSPLPHTSSLLSHYLIKHRVILRFTLLFLILLEGMRKIARDVIQDSRCRSRYLNRDPVGYALHFRLTFLV